MAARKSNLVQPLAGRASNVEGGVRPELSDGRVPPPATSGSLGEVQMASAFGLTGHSQASTSSEAMQSPATCMGDRCSTRGRRGSEAFVSPVGSSQYHSAASEAQNFQAQGAAHAIAACRRPAADFTAAGWAARAAAMFVVGTSEPVPSGMSKATTPMANGDVQLASKAIGDWVDAHGPALTACFGNFDRWVGLGWLLADAFESPHLDRKQAFDVGSAARKRLLKFTADIAKQQKVIGRGASMLASNDPARQRIAQAQADAERAIMRAAVAPPLPFPEQSPAAAVGAKRKRAVSLAQAAPAPAPAPVLPAPALAPTPLEASEAELAECERALEAADQARKAACSNRDRAEELRQGSAARVDRARRRLGSAASDAGRLQLQQVLREALQEEAQSIELLHSGGEAVDASGDVVLQALFAQQSARIRELCERNRVLSQSSVSGWDSAVEAWRRCDELEEENERLRREPQSGSELAESVADCDRLMTMLNASHEREERMHRTARQLRALDALRIGRQWEDLVGTWRAIAEARRPSNAAAPAAVHCQCMW